MTNLSNLYTNINNLVKGYEKQNGSDGASSNTVFTLTNAYIMGNNTLMVFVNGQKAEKVTSASDATEYEETNSYTITFGSSLQDIDVVEFYIVSPYNLSQDNFDTMINSYQGEIGGFGGYRNKIINGDFDIWQRDTSQSSGGYGSDDRWYNTFNGSSATFSRSVFDHGQTAVPDNPTFYSTTVVSSSAGAANYVYKLQKIENVRTFAGETATVTFYAKASTFMNLSTECYQNFGSGGSTAVTGIGIEKFSLTTSWQKFTKTITFPSTSGKTSGVGNFIGLIFWMDAGSNYNSRTDSLGQQSGTIDISHVQFEKGFSSTDFECRHIAQELALCQRYFIKLAAYYYIPRGYNTEGYLNLLFPVKMRVTPTSSYTLSQTTSDHLAVSQDGIYGYIQADWTGTPSMVAGATFDAEL